MDEPFIEHRPIFGDLPLRVLQGNLSGTQGSVGLVLGLILGPNSDDSCEKNGDERLGRITRWNEGQDAVGILPLVTGAIAEHEMP